FAKHSDILRGHNKWEGRIYKVLRQNLESEDWTEKRNTLLLLSQSCESYPVVEKYARGVLQCVENLRDREKANDLKTLANSLAVKLRATSKSWIKTESKEVVAPAFERFKAAVQLAKLGVAGNPACQEVAKPKNGQKKEGKEGKESKEAKEPKDPKKEDGATARLASYDSDGAAHCATVPPVLGSFWAEAAACAMVAPHFGVRWEQRSGPDSQGWQAALLHPSCLHVALSARRLGGVDWAAVRRVAEAGDALEAKAIFRHLGGKQTSPERTLLDAGSLCVAYAALLTNRRLRLRWREACAPKPPGATRPRDGEVGLEVYSTRAEELKGAGAATGPILASRPLLCSRRLGLCDPRLLLPWRKKAKPRWPKAWDYAQKMMAGEEFPPVSIAWGEERRQWFWRDGCHRYFAALVSSKFLRVSFKDPARAQKRRDDDVVVRVPVGWTDSLVLQDARGEGLPKSGLSNGPKTAPRWRPSACATDSAMPRCMPPGMTGAGADLDLLWPSGPRGEGDQFDREFARVSAGDVRANGRADGIGEKADAQDGHR
ncbi:unnamed protein product, partial [Effrenium voratum]